MVEGTEKELLITLDFSGTKKKFADIDELHEFMQSQRDAWSWLEQVAREDDNLAQVWEPFKGYFMQVDQFIEGLEREPDDQAKQTEQINILKSQTKIAVNQGFTLADTPSARFILDLKDDKSPQIAGYALASLNKEKINPDDPAANEGVYLAMQYLQGSTADSIKAQQRWADRFEKQHGELEDSNKQLIRKATELQEQSDLLASRAEDQATRQAIIFKQQVTKNENIFTDQIADQENRLRILTTELQEQSHSQAIIFEQQVGNQKEIFKNQVVKYGDDIANQIANQEKNFREQAAELQEKTDLLTKKAEEQTTSQVIISKQQIAKHLNILIGQRDIQAYKFRQQALKYENDFFNRSNSHERRFGEQTTMLADDFGEQTTMLTDDFGKQTTMLADDFGKHADKLTGGFEKRAYELTGDFEKRAYELTGGFEKRAYELTGGFERLEENLAKDFKAKVQLQEKKFTDLYDQTAKNFKQFKDFLNLSAPYHEAARYWRRKKIGHYFAQILERLTAVAIAIITGVIFFGAAFYLFADDSNDIKMFIDGIIDSIISDAEASDAVTCDSVVCRAVAGAPALCETVDSSQLSCSLVPCSSAVCNPVDCKAVDCEAVDCKAVDCKAVDCKAAPCEPAASSATTTSTTTTSTTVKVNTKPKNDPLENIWKVSILLMISTLGFWLTRVSARGFATNRHLGMDSHERATILFTYLALQNSENPLKDNERPIVLETIFRPGSTGLIKDDGPSPIPESLAKAFVKVMRKN